MILEARGILDTDKIQRLTETFSNRIDEIHPFRDVSIHTWPEDRTSKLMLAASLAHHSVLGPVRMMTLLHVDLSPVPASHLASLFCSVTCGQPNFKSQG